MRIENCSFCGAPVYPGHGQIFIRNDCKIFRFCTGKCRKNFGMKRNPMKLKWTKTFRKANGKELSVDSTMDFEKKRHVPVKYNRELVQNTLKVMKRVQEIKTRRQQDLYNKRMERAGRQEKREAVHALKHNIDWIEDIEIKHKAKDDMEAVQKLEQEKKEKRQAQARAKMQKRRADDKAMGVSAASSVKKR